MTPIVGGRLAVPGAQGRASPTPTPFQSGRTCVEFLTSAFCFLVCVVLLHFPLLRLPYFWDEIGYYIPAAMDFFHSWKLVPSSTLHTGHPPLVIVYLGLAWRAFGFSPLVTRAAMLVVAACTLAGVYALGRRVAGREAGYWSVMLLALSPLFFAQSTMAHLDLTAGLFTLLALIALLSGRPASFALAATCAVLSKETAVVLAPLGWWFFCWRARRGMQPMARAWWAAFLCPLAALVAWEVFYHHVTGVWTGNSEYLRYNLYSTLNPVRALLALVRRLFETFVSGFNWLLTAGAIAGFYWSHRKRMGGCPGGGPLGASEEPALNQSAQTTQRQLFFIGGWLIAIYLVMLSVVGGAILPRYLLPIYPPLVLIAVILIRRLPKLAARSLLALTACCFVWAWFLNPPYPFPYEDNLAYADFVQLHERAAQFLEAQAGDKRVLTAWPATDELARPSLGYVRRPLHIVASEGFAGDDFRSISMDSFDCLYLYSRRWEPANNWLERFPRLLRLQARYFEYQPQAREDELVAKYHLRLLASFEKRGQWVRIYVIK